METFSLQNQTYFFKEFKSKDGIWKSKLWE
jgi:hypothetical protein